MKSYFPIFSKYPQLCYFDSSATTLKPVSVIDATMYGMSHYSISCEKNRCARALDTYNKTLIAAEQKIKAIFGLSEYFVVFNQTVSIILEKIFFLLKKKYLVSDRPIIVLVPESYHRSLGHALYVNNINYIFIKAESCDLAEYQELDIVYVPYINHITGKMINIDELKKYKKKFSKVFIILDASQGLLHYCPNLYHSEVDCIMGSSHKMYGPDGIAWVAVHTQWSKIFSWHGILSVRNDFYAGSLSYPSVYAYIIALNFLEKYIYHNTSYQETLRQYVDEIKFFLAQYSDQLTLLSCPQASSHIISFSHKKFHAHDIADCLSKEDICLRSGDICAPGIDYKFGIIRISFGCYNNYDDVSKLIDSLKEVFTKESFDLVSK
jgi:selenocysteine lyase/cysteine desulfurase